MRYRIRRFTRQKGFSPLAIIVVTGALLLVTVAAVLRSNDNLLKRVLGIQTSNTTLNTPPIQVTLPSTPTPTIAPAYQPAYKTVTDPLIDCIGPDGKHLQLTQQACDDFNAAWGKGARTTNQTSGSQNSTGGPYQGQRTIPESELIAAINAYRQSHGLSTLSTNSALCDETRKRVQDMINLNVGKTNDAAINLNHDGMAQDVNNGTLANHVGKQSYGENIAYAYCKRPSDNVVVDITTGTQLVEWCFDSSAVHRENLLRPDWTDVCSSGQFPFYVEMFAK